MVDVTSAPSAALGGAGGIPSINGGDAGPSQAQARLKSSLDFNNDFIIGNANGGVLPVLGIGALVLVVWLVIR